MPLLPSERSIRERLEERAKRSPAEFQKIAEDFLAKRDPDRYRGLRPQGRNPDLQTTKGFPDAYAPIGRDLHLVEATTGSWRSHLEQSDSKRLSKIENAASYTFFALESADKLIPQESRKGKDAAPVVRKDERYYKELIAARGVPREAIEFIFLDQLVRELRSAKYAAILRDIGLPYRTPPFEHVDDMVESDPDAPRREDFRTSEVVDRRKCDRLYTLLRQSRIPIIVGLGGVGKTTMGLSLAYRWMNQYATGAYYADVKLALTARGHLTHEILEALDMYDGTRELFVIDNIHLLGKENLSRLMDKAQSENAPPTLFLARSFDGDVILSHPVRARARFALHPLAVDEADLLAAYQFVQRRAKSIGVCQLPTDDRLAEWLRVAPDLVLFLAALKSQRRRIVAGLTPVLHEDDAIQYVKTHFVDVLSGEDRNHLIAIAKLATLEIPASEACLGGIEPRNLIARELVAASAVSASAPTKRYALPHDALGPLILRCFDDEEISAVWRHVLERDAFQATYIAHQLLDIGQVEEARAILSAVSDRIWRFTPAVPPGYAFVLHDLFHRAGLPGPDLLRLKWLYRTFIDENEAFLSGARSFLEFIKSIDGDVDDFITLLLDASPARLRVAVMLAQPAELGQLMLRDESQGATRLATSIRRLLAEPAVSQAFVNHFFQLALGDANRVLALILRGGAQVQPEIEDALRDCDDGMLSLLDRVGGALRTERGGPMQWKHVIELLAQTRHSAELVQWLGSNAKHVEYLLRAAAGAGPHTRRLIDRVLATADLSRLVASGSEASWLYAEAMLAVTDEQVLSRLLHALPAGTSLASLVLFWHPQRMVEVLMRIERMFTGSQLVAFVRNAVLRALHERLHRAVAERRVLATVRLRHAWRILDAPPSELVVRADAMALEYQQELRHLQEKRALTPLTPRTQFDLDAIAGAVGTDFRPAAPI